MDKPHPEDFVNVMQKVSSDIIMYTSGDPSYVTTSGVNDTDIIRYITSAWAKNVGKASAQSTLLLCPDHIELETGSQYGRIDGQFKRKFRYKDYATVYDLAPDVAKYIDMIFHKHFKLASSNGKPPRKRNRKRYQFGVQGLV